MNLCNSANCGNYKCHPDNTVCLTVCSSDDDCTEDNKCDSGRCIRKNTFDKYKIWIILGIVIAGLILIVSGYFIFRHFSKGDLPTEIFTIPQNTAEIRKFFDDY